MATVTEVVKESLLGSSTPENLSTESRATFTKHSHPDDNGVLFMSEEDFINAIAPPEEDYVSPLCSIQAGMVLESRHSDASISSAA